MKLINVKKASQLLKNSITNNWEVIKINRLSWEAYSIKEAKTWLTNKWTKSDKRIIIWLNDDWELILIDWTNLLEAYRQLNKDIPENIFDFTSKEAKNIFLEKIN